MTSRMPRPSAPNWRRPASTAVDAQPDRLEFGWTREAYLDFKEDYDEWDLFDSLSSA